MLWSTLIFQQLPNPCKNLFIRHWVKRVQNLASQIRKGLTASQNSKPHRLAMLFNLKGQAKLRFLRGCAES